MDCIDRFVNDVSESGKRVLLLLDDVVNDIRKSKGVDKALARPSTWYSYASTGLRSLNGTWSK